MIARVKWNLLGRLHWFTNSYEREDPDDPRRPTRKDKAPARI